MINQPIPGQSLTGEPKAYPWENPSQLTTVEEAVNAYVSKKTGSPATSSWEELMMNEDEDNSIQ